MILTLKKDAVTIQKHFLLFPWASAAVSGIIIEELQDEFDPKEESIDDGDPHATTLNVGRLPPPVDENFLPRQFGRFGPIARVKMKWPRKEGEEPWRLINYGIDALKDRDEGKAAKDEMQGVVAYENELITVIGKAEIAGHVVEFIVDRYGSRFIKQQLDSDTIVKKSRDYQEFMPQPLALMTDVFNNHVIQQFFAHGLPSQQRQIEGKLSLQVLTLNLQYMDVEEIQKGIQVVDSNQQIKIGVELNGVAALNTTWKQAFGFGKTTTTETECLETWLNNICYCNELIEGYVDDGYDRCRSVGACVVTVVGGLNVLNEIVDADAGQQYPFERGKNQWMEGALTTHLIQHTLNPSISSFSFLNSFLAKLFELLNILFLDLFLPIAKVTVPTSRI